MTISVNSPKLSATGHDRYVNLNWQINSKSGIKGYTLFRDYNVIANLTADATSYINTGLNADTTYTYHIVAEAISGYLSTSSNIIDTKTIKLFHPGIPRQLNVIIDSSNSQAVISWINPVNYGNSDYVTYDYSILIDYNQGNNQLNSENNTKKNQLTINNLADVVGYDIRVRANNGLYTSNWTSIDHGSLRAD